MTAERSWSVALLAATEAGRRNRRTIDSVFFVWAAVVVGLTAVIASKARGRDIAVEHALHTLFGWADALWRIAFVGLIVLAVVIVFDVVMQRRWALMRDVLVALVAVVGAGVLLGWIVESDWLPLEPHLLARWGYPEVRLAAATAVLVVTGPELVRPVRLLAFWSMPFALVGAVVLGATRPSAALAALALGLAAGALVRLVFGTAAGVPPSDVIQAALASLGVEVREFRPAAQQHVGAAEYFGLDRDGLPLKVRVLGRDAQDTQRLARHWRSLAYRDPPRSVANGRLEQVEHEALATLMAAQAGVNVPKVVMAALGPEGDAIVVTRQPDNAPLESMAADDVSTDLLRDLWEQVARLQAAGISHGRLNASNILVVDGRPMLVDFSAATLGAPQSALDIDVAELLVACTILVGPDRALREGIQAGWAEPIGRVLPYVQRAALSPHLRDLARAHEVGIKQLRSAAAAATGTPDPELVSMRRVRPKDLLLTAALIFAAYLLITRLAKIGFGTIAHELRGAEIAWIVVALIIAQLALVPSGVALRGAVPTPLPLLPCIVLQSAIKFINLTVPSSAGRIGMNLRFLQRLGAPLPEAVASSAIDDIAERVVQLLLFLAVISFVHPHLNSSVFHGAGPDSRLLEAIAAAIVISAIVLLAVPRLRARIVPPVRIALGGLWAVARDRQKRLELFGGRLATELLYALALGATCLAYGVKLDLAELIFVNTAASVLSSLIPVPGGIGAAEASISASLIAVGVDQPTAFAIAITQRLSTFYLPPIWGYVSLRWLNRKGYV